MKLKNFKCFLIFSMILLLISCGGKDKIDEKQKLDNVDIVLDWYPNAIHCFIYNAIEKGYFKDEGINVNIHFPANTYDALTLPASKKADIGIYYLHHLIMARVNENIPVKSIGAIVQKPLNVIISLKENNITRPRDLENKTIGYSGAVLTEKTIKDMVACDGGNPENIKLVDVGFDLLTSMITKRVDATNGGLVNHEVPVMINKGFDVNYFYPNNYGIPDYYEEVFVANEDLIKEKKDVYIRFLRACQKGFKDMKNNKEDSLNILLGKQEAQEFPLTYDVEKQSIDILIPLMEEKKSPFLSQDEKVWQKNIDWLYEHQIIDKKANANEMFINLYNEK